MAELKKWLQMQDNTLTISFSPAEKAGVFSLGISILSLFIFPTLAVIPLVFFLLLCFAAPFFPRWSFFLPIISRGPTGEDTIAVTFDDGPSLVTTPIVLELLAQYKIKATFFVIGKQVARCPGLIEEIISQGHTIGNHSWDHDYFLMLRGGETIARSIHRTQESVLKSGLRPLVFRPPTGITGPRLGRVLAREGLVTVNYSCRAFDRGNRNINNLAAKILKRVHPGDIIMLHDLPCREKGQLQYWKKELEALFVSLKEKYTIVPLEEVIRQPVMMIDNGKVP